METGRNLHRCLIAGVLIALLLPAMECQSAEKPFLNETKEQRDERMAWWREARFGMFIHWGLYAVPAGQWEGKEIGGISEWIMNSAQIPIPEYEKLTKQFNPVKFNAEQWVRMAKRAGMKYIVITSKHHDGFCLWDSKVSEYDVMDATPFKRDILKELSEACNKAGIKFCFYHSIMDWHHPDAQGPHWPKYNTDEKKNPNFGRYVKEYLKPQLKELVTNYGPLGVLWFDGEWIPEWNEEFGTETYYFVRSLQPDIIINNRVGKGRQGMEGTTQEGFFGGDYGTPEQEIPATGLPGADWETCMTMNDSWGFKENDHNWKSTEELIHNLVDIASKGGNYLLNVGPTAEGLIPSESVARLRDIGRWIRFNGESIYGTSASPFRKLDWGRCTQKALPDGKTRLYLHVFDWPIDGKLVAGGLDNKVVNTFLLAKGKDKSLPVRREGNDVIIEVASKAPDSIDSVVAVDIEGSAVVIEPPDISGTADIFIDTMAVTLKSDVKGSQIRYTLDGSEPTPASPLYNEPIQLSETATVQAQLFREDKAISHISQRTFKKVQPRETEDVEGLRPSLRYEYYEGEWDELPDFDSLEMRAEGAAEGFDISLRKRDERFGFRFSGYIKVARTGVYRFYLESDDGSKLFIGEQCIVDNDGLHGSNVESGMIALGEGVHPITVTFFQKTGGLNLELFYSGEGLEMQEVPPSALFH
jgi:alpha-L-fucosidase